MTLDYQHVSHIVPHIFICFNLITSYDNLLKLCIAKREKDTLWSLFVRCHTDRKRKRSETGSAQFQSLCL